MAGESLHVCHFLSDDAWGGLEVMALSLLQAQQASAQFKVSLIVLNEGRLEQEARRLGVTVRLIPESKMGPWSLYRQLERTLRHLRPDIVHTHRYKENLLAYLVAPRLRLRTVVTIHGWEPSLTLPVRIRVGLRDFVSFRLARRANARFAAVSRDLQHNYRIPDDSCTVIPNGIRIQPTPTAVRANGQAASAPVIGWAGRMVAIKSLGTLLDAVALLNDLPVKPRLLLVGDGPDRTALAEQAQRLGIAEQVEFTGFVNDLTPHLARMSLFALPSLQEGVPLALLEAMGAGIPTLAAGVGGIPEMIGDSGAAHLVRGHVPADWAAAIRRFVTSPNEANEMADLGRALVMNRFSLEAMLARYSELYAQALGRSA
ncbi:MAG: glycosyltransferase family 4 protein [Longimicrobiales bacterium]